jgi:hypothetical protein
MQIIEDGYGGNNEQTDNQAENIIRMLISLVYSLCPDEEYEELFQIQETIDKAEQYLNSLEGV